MPSSTGCERDSRRPAYAFEEAKAADFSEIAAFLAREKYGLRKQEWLEWKYEKNPLGKGRVFLIRDSDKNIRGMFGIVPCSFFSLDGKQTSGMQAVDLFVEPGFRGQKIGREILEVSTRLLDAPAIGFPNEGAEAIMTTLGWHRVGPLDRWYFPIRSDVTLLNGLIRLHSAAWLSRCGNQLEMNPVNEFRHNFEGSVCWGHQGNSAEFLNWRYIHSPLKRYACFGFSDAGKQIGYCIMHADGEQAEIYDFFVVHKARGCFRKIVDDCLKSGVKHLFFRGMGLPIMKYGFVKLASRRRIISLHLGNERLFLTLGASDW